MRVASFTHRDTSWFNSAESDVNGTQRPHRVRVSKVCREALFVYKKR